MDISTKIIDDAKLRYCEIYEIKNIVTEKVYIGQAVSHILNHKRYRPYGAIGRFKCHISEAFSNKKKQCVLLNNSIRKYGSHNFIVNTIETCSLSVANEREKYYIQLRNSLFPNGYNLRNGGNTSAIPFDIREKVSKGVCEYYSDKKFDKFSDITNIPSNLECIRPLKRFGKQYGWYVYIQGKKADFGGVHISLEESKKRSEDFTKHLREKLAKHLDAGNSLEPLTTTL